VSCPTGNQKRLTDSGESADSGSNELARILGLQKTLEGANIKLDSVITDIVRKSGRAMIQAPTRGQTDPVKSAALADLRIKVHRHVSGYLLHPVRPAYQSCGSPEG
jgi:hypothetical protein